MVQPLYLIVLAGACLVGIGVAYAAWTNRETTGADLLAATGLAVVIWAGGTIGLTLATAPTAELRWLQISYVGIVASPIVFVLLALTYTGYERYVSGPLLVGLIGVGIAFLLLVWTNPMHSLYWSEIDYAAAVPEGISTTPGPGFWALVVFTYGLLLVGSTLFVRYALTAPRLYRVQTVAILIAVAAPWAANVPHALQLMSADYTPIALSVTVASLWVAMFRYRLSDVGPVALRTVFESISTGVYVLDRHDRVIEANAAGRELLGVSEDENVIGSPFRKIAPSDALYERVRADDSHDPEEARDVVAVDGLEDARGKPSDRRYFEVTVMPVEPARDRGDTRAVVITDVTAAQRQQRQLQAQNERLDQFASVVSHDLRNPLFVAQGRLELAAEEHESEHLEHVRRAHERMTSLIDDLLVLARQGESVRDPEPVDFVDLVERCWDTVETADADLTVSVDGRPEIPADEGRLRQLLENLVRNAVEHGGEDVTVTIGELEDGFYVQDDGAGIPEAERAEVFDAGYSTGSDGNGFGLQIVEQIAEAHGWTVRVTEGPEGGARFEITGAGMRR